MNDTRKAFAQDPVSGDSIYQCPSCSTRDGRIVGNQAGRKYIHGGGYHRYVAVLIECNQCHRVRRIEFREEVPHGSVVLEMKDEEK